MPELLGTKETLGEIFGDAAYYTSREDLVDIFTTYLDGYPHHTVLYGKALDIRQHGRDELKVYAEWFIRELFAAMDYADRVAKGEPADELRTTL